MSHSVGNDAPTSAAKLLPELPKHYIPGQSNILTSLDAQSIGTNRKCLLNAFPKILRFTSYCVKMIMTPFSLSTKKGPTLLKYILLLESPKTMKGRSYFMAPRVDPLIHMFTDTTLAENL